MDLDLAAPNSAALTICRHSSAEDWKADVTAFHCRSFLVHSFFGGSGLVERDSANLSKRLLRPLAAPPSARLSIVENLCAVRSLLYTYFRKAPRVTSKQTPLLYDSANIVRGMIRASINAQGARLTRCPLRISQDAQVRALALGDFSNEMRSDSEKAGL